MGHFSVAPGSEVAGIRNGFQIYGFIHTQLPQGGGQANFFDKICQSLYTGASQFSSVLSWGEIPHTWTANFWNLERPS